MQLELATGESVTVDYDTPHDILNRRWRRNNTGGVECSYRENGKVKSITLAAAIRGNRAAAGHVWSHQNGDTMDFRYENLEMIPRGVWIRRKGLTQQRAPEDNALGYAGVARQENGYRARRRVGGRVRVFGSYATPEEAGFAYDEALRQTGEAPVNHIRLPEADARRIREKVAAVLQKAGLRSIPLSPMG